MTLFTWKRRMSRAILFISMRSPDIGGTNQGMRPMQMLLAAMGGCSSIDIINILEKTKAAAERF